MDLDYRALGNAGLWCLGRLQVDADRARVLDGLALGDTGRDDAGELALTLQRLAPRWFVTRDAHSAEGAVLVQPRWTMSFMRGPMTRAEIRMALGQHRSTNLEAKSEPIGASNGQAQIRHQA
jgi:hypothetical protein